MKNLRAIDEEGYSGQGKDGGLDERYGSGESANNNPTQTEKRCCN